MQKLEERQELRKIAIVQQQLASRARGLDKRCVRAARYSYNAKKVKEASKAQNFLGRKNTCHTHTLKAPCPAAVFRACSDELAPCA